MEKQPYILSEIDFYRCENDCRIEFPNREKKAVKLYFGETPEAESIKTLVAKGLGEVVEFSLPVEKGPYYYKLVVGETSHVFGERLLPLQGAINVRDMGGYTTTTGKTVNWGMLYRGDQLSKLTSEDIKYLEKIRLQSIIDFRSKKERELNPNYKLSTVHSIFECDPQSSVAEAAGEAVSFEKENRRIVENLENGAVPKEELNGSGKAFHKNYREFVTKETGKKAFSHMLKALVSLDNCPVLMHCRGGKDRTGFGAALTLAVLGVGEAQIIEDYLITQAVRKERNKYKMTLYAEHTDNQAVLDYLEAMIDTRIDYIQSSFAAIYENYGTVENYVVEGLGLSKIEIEKIRKNFLH